MLDPMLEQSTAEKCVHLLRLIGDEEMQGRDLALERMLELGLETTFPSLEEALRSDDDADLRNAAMEVLIRFGGKSVPRLTVLLTDRDEEVRSFSALMLGEVGCCDAVPALVEALSDRDVNVSHCVAEALGKIGDPCAAPALIGLLSKDFWLQFPAVVALGKVRAKEGVPYLLQLLDDEMLTEVVLEALGEIGDSTALPRLWEIIARPDHTFFSSSARAILAITAGEGRSSGEAGVEPILEKTLLARLHALARGGAGELADCAVRLLGIVNPCLSPLAYGAS